MAKTNRADLTLRNLGPIKTLRADLKALQIAVKQLGYRVDEAISRIEGLESVQRKR